MPACPLLLIPYSSFLIKKNNLLAFSAGIDSSALFFLLIEHNISFDIAIVDYGVRDQSKDEIAHALALAEKHNLKCYTAKAPKFDGDFEKNARDFRYRFFEQLIKKHGYNNLLTAHQLNDRLEWLLMRLCKGAGVNELIGLESVSQRDDYQLIRPLLEYSKEDLKEYLDKNGYPYFIDESNTDEKHERNRFRKLFSDPMIEEFKDGIKKSLKYLERDKEYITSDFGAVYSCNQLRVIKLKNKAIKARAADIALKELGYLLSSAQREEIEKGNSLVIGGKWAIETQDDILYISPYETVDMPKPFKEQCRLLKIPHKIRPYLYMQGIDPESLATSKTKN